MRGRLLIALSVWSCLGAAPASAGQESPLAVSPGSRAGAVIGDTCPTFSWGAVAGARAYELVVYRLGAAGVDGDPVLFERLPGTAAAWTPSLERCLERSRRYAWSVRATGRRGTSEWSAPALFQVASGLAVGDLQQALAVVRRHLAAEGEPATAAAKPTGGETASAPAPVPGLSAASPAAPQGPATALSVEGNVAATSFTGDGAALSNVVAADLIGTACVSESELTFDPTTQSEMDTHSGLASAHHVPTVDTTCHGAACDGANFTNLQWSNLTALPPGFADNVDDACTVTDNGDGTATLTCDDGSSFTWRPGIGTLDVSAGWYHTCALLSFGPVVCWGDDEFSQSSPPSSSFRQVSAGWAHTCGLKWDKTVACWGNDTYGQSTPPSGGFSQISADGNHACGVKSDSSVVCWGDDRYGQSTPPSGSFSQVSAGAGHSCGLKSHGVVSCWGNDDDGQSKPPSGVLTQVSAGGHHSCGVESDGSVACWGRDDDGQSSPPSAKFTQVSAGGSHTCGVVRGGSVACWGQDGAGQSSPPEGTFTQVSAGVSHTCGLRAGGALECWGWDIHGRSSPPPGLR